MDHLGCGIWSQIRRITGASLNGSRPAQISTSAWRGEKLIRSMPKRAMSNRLAAVAMNSMAQQAVPNGMGQSELLRAQLVRKSSRVVTQLGETDETVVAVVPAVLGGGIGQSHCSAPRFQMYTYPTARITMKTNISMISRPAMSVSWRKATAQGIMNTVSMSKMMNSIATR